MIQELRKVLIKRKTQPAFTAALAIPVAEPPFKFKQFKDFEAGFDLEPPSLYVFSPEANFAELTEAKSFHVNFLGFVETFYAERNASAPDNLIRLVWVKAIDPSKYQP